MFDNKKGSIIVNVKYEFICKEGDGLGVMNCCKKLKSKKRALIIIIIAVIIVAAVVFMTSKEMKVSKVNADTKKEDVKRGYIKNEDENDKEQPISNFRGNTMNNLSNYGYVAGQGKWIYYRNFSDNGVIYKMREDGSGKVKLTKNPGSYINVVGEWVYYVSDEGIFKVKTDGGEEKKIRDIKDDNEFLIKTLPQCKEANTDALSMRLLNENIESVKSGKSKAYINNLNVIGDKIYYRVAINNHFEGFLIEMDVDGRLCKSLQLHISSWHMAMDENSIYYWELLSSRNKGPAYKLNLDGSNEAELIKNVEKFAFIQGKGNSQYKWYAISDVTFDGTDIYFNSLGGQGKLCFKQDKDNNVTEVNISNEGKREYAEAMNAYNGFLYYSTEEGIFKIKSDGSNRIKLHNKLAGNIFIVGDWMYFTECSTEYDKYGKVQKLCRMKLDGTNKEDVN